MSTQKILLKSIHNFVRDPANNHQYLGIFIKSMIFWIQHVQYNLSKFNTVKLWIEAPGFYQYK